MGENVLPSTPVKVSCETRFGQPLTQGKQASFAMLPGRKPGDAVLDNDDRTIDDQPEVERAQAHQIT